jgi:hypothetical protein
MAQEIGRETAVAEMEPGPDGPVTDYEVGLESLSQWQLAWR